MKKFYLMKSFGVVAVLALFISGCSDSIKVKSVEEYQKLSKEELETMSQECRESLKEIWQDEKNSKEFQEIGHKILESGGKNPLGSYIFTGNLTTFGNVTDEQLAKYGNSEYAKFVECGRINIANGSASGRYKNSDRYRNVGKEQK